MSSKRGRIKRTKNVRNLDSFDAASLAQSIIEEHSNIIPVGRQLERTPPSKSERVTIHQPSKPNGSPTSGQVVKEELCGQEITKHLSCNGSNEVLQHPNVKDERKSVRRSSSTAASATPGNANPEIFIQGMEGYQWTDTDLEFVYQTKWKKQIQQAQQELSNLKWSLKSTKQTRDMELTALDKIQTELSKVLACERIQQISMEVLLRSQSSSQLEGLDLKALLAQLKVADVHCTTAEEKTEVSKLKTEVEKAQVLREKEKQLTKDIDSYKMNINQIKVNIDALTTEISALESQLSSKEAVTHQANGWPTAGVFARCIMLKFSSNPNQTHLNKLLNKTSESLESYRQEAPQSAKPRQKAQRGTKPSTAPKPPKPPASPPASKTSKPSAAPKTSKPPASSRSPKTSKPLAAPKTSEPPASPPVPKTSKPLAAPKTSKPSAAPKTSKPLAASKTSKPPSSPPASKTSKPTATQKAKTASKPSKPTTAPKAPEGDVGDLRRSKRIAAKKEK
ncbi:SH3 domain-containing protein C23A1.17 [Labeo rohita]|uniref:SH3 domain-containing protein C23A1.17 n=1 Tax=Labeo rohita TaxID=84645 RepID=A0ABQ8LJA2_LABRO|nr:SH3 domain-containing protein C23A1.17 [Labeo rohita]